MKTVEIAIKLPKEVYEKIQQIDRIISGRRNGKTIEFALWNGVKNGTVLEEGHGRLIDAGKLKTHFIGTEQGTDLEVYLVPTIIDAPTIIEADKEDADEI